MNLKKIEKILKDTEYVRIGGSEDELRAAEYIQSICKEMGVSSKLENFKMQASDIKKQQLLIDGKEIPAKAFQNCGNANFEAPFMYMPNVDAVSLADVKGKVVLIDTGVTYWVFKDLYEHGCSGIITHNGSIYHNNNDIDQKELRSYVADGKKLPCFNINAKDAFALVKKNPNMVKMVISQKEYETDSRNVVATIKGEIDEYITFTAHYDSTPLSVGAYDNMTGCLGLLGIMEHFTDDTPHYTLKFIFCGSEERGLMGSKAYCKKHEKELPKCVLNINLDMIGTYMGKFIACCSAEERLKGYIEYLGDCLGWSIAAKQGVYSSDSTPFADKGIPAVSFARIINDDFAPIHNRYDTKAVLSPEQIRDDIDFLTVFSDDMAYAGVCPVKREIPEEIKKELDKYLNRTR